MPILVTGGARSGKSTFAEKLAMRLGNEGFYIATSQYYDDEMRERIALHRQQREGTGFSWLTKEEPYRLRELLEFLQTSANEDSVILVDCMTLWLSNWLLVSEDRAEATRETRQKLLELVETVSSFKGHLVIVTNEVGSSIVPEYPLGRLFRDLAGTMNQRLAEKCEQVFLVTAGIPIELKSRAYKLD
jgi:adenosylcobinamide kinase / adenosylcobinamide-phosphate guanylyltransferase